MPGACPEPPLCDSSHCMPLISVKLPDPVGEEYCYNGEYSQKKYKLHGLGVNHVLKYMWEIMTLNSDL